MFKYVSLNIACARGCARATACKVGQQKEHLNPTKLHLHRSPIGRKKNAVGSRKSLPKFIPVRDSRNRRVRGLYQRNQASTRQLPHLAIVQPRIASP
jgi:hypothetical protein